MNQIEKLLQEANLPKLLDREQMKKILLDNEYGYVPNIPYEMTVSEPKMLEGRFCCGNCQLTHGQRREHQVADGQIQTAVKQRAKIIGGGPDAVGDQLADRAFSEIAAAYSEAGRVAASDQNVRADQHKAC